MLSRGGKEGGGTELTIFTVLYLPPDSDHRPRLRERPTFVLTAGRRHFGFAKNDKVGSLTSSDRFTNTKGPPMGSQGRFAARIRTTALSAMR